jgi:hypothetical protein
MKTAKYVTRGILALLALLALLGWPTNVPMALAQDKNPGPSLQQSGLTIVGSPLSISVFDGLAMQVNYNGATQFFSDTAGGTFIDIDGVVYGSDPPASFGLSPLALTAVSNAGPTGSGTEASPFTITTVARAGSTGIEITQKTTYVNGASRYKVELAAKNTGSASHTVRIFHGADLYLNFPGNARDYGYGIYDSVSGAIGALSQDGLSLQVFIPITPVDAYQEARYGTFWSQIGTASSAGPGLNNTFNSSFHDVAAGLQYNRTLAAGASASVSLYGAFGLVSDIGVTPNTTEQPRSVNSADVHVVVLSHPNYSAAPGSIVTYDVKVVNTGKGHAKSTTVTLPINPAVVEVVDAAFSSAGAWVTSATVDTLVFKTGPIAGKGGEVDATIRLRVKADASAGAALTDRAGLHWSDAGSGGDTSSNLPILTVGSANDNRESYSLTSESASGSVGSHFSFASAIFASKEPVGIWWNLPDGSVEAGPTYFAEADGSLSIDFDSGDLPAGTYSFVFYGHWTGFTAVAPFTIK